MEIGLFKSQSTINMKQLASLFGFVLVSANIGVPSSVGQAQPVRRSNCTDARIISPIGGRLLCRNEIAVPFPLGQTKIICLNTPIVQPIQSRRLVSDICTGRPAHAPCDVKNLGSCYRIRSGKSPDFAVLRPYGGVLRPSNPQLHWTSVPGATAYRVELESGVAKWAALTTTTTRTYPSEFPLRPGQIYILRVSALKGDTTIATTTATYLVPPQHKLQELESLLSQLRGADNSALFVHREWQSVFVSYGLWNDAIDVLQNQISQGVRDPVLYRTLGDRYFELYRLDAAKASYSRAIALETNPNSDTVQLAQSALDEIRRVQDQRQLPSNSQGPQ
jgi:hypothetical protein